MKIICENAMRDVLISLANEVLHTVHFIDANEADRPAIKAEILKGVKKKLKNKYNEELDDSYIEAYISDYIDDLASDVISGKKVNECDTFSTGVEGSTGLVNGIPNSGDGIGLYATPMTRNSKKKKKKKIKVKVTD